MGQTVDKNVMAWYTIRTQNNMEKWVSDRIRVEFEISNLSDCLGQIIIPHEKVVTVRNGKKIIRDKMTYPGYVFIETSALGELKHFLKTITGAGGLVRTQSGEITQMRESDVKRILTTQEDVDITKTDKVSHNYVVGENVLITDGPFQSFSGTIENIDGEKVRITVMIFSRKTPVDLTVNQIERAK